MGITFDNLKKYNLSFRSLVKYPSKVEVQKWVNLAETDTWLLYIIYKRARSDYSLN